MPAEAGWHAVESSGAPGTYETGGGFSQSLPLVVLQRAGVSQTDHAMAQLGAALSSDPTWQGLGAADWHAQVRGLRVDLYDFGVAVLVLTLDLSTPSTCALAKVAATVKRLALLRPTRPGGTLPPFGLVTQEIAWTSIAELDAAVTASARPAGEADPLAPDSFAKAEAGRLLWLHPVIHLVSDHASAFAADAEALAPTFHEAMDVYGGRFAPGIGTSAIVTTASPDSADAVLRLIERHWAVFAYYMVADRRLLLMLDRIQSSSPGGLRALEHEASQVFECQAAIQHVRSRIDSALTSLGGDGQAIWDRIASVQNFETVAAGVERKTKLLRDIAERRVQEASIAASRRTGCILGSLTALTVVTVTIGLLGAFLGSHSANADDIALRLWIVILAGFASIAVFVFAFPFWNRTRRSPERRRRKSAG